MQLNSRFHIYTAFFLFSFFVKKNSHTQEYQEITSNCLLFVRYFFLGIVVHASLSEPSPNSIICSNWHAKLLPCFPTSSFDHNFGTNDTQTFNVYAESTLVLYRKDLCNSSLERSVTSFKDQRKY